MGTTKVETNGSKPPSSSPSPIPTVPTWVNEDHFVDVIEKQVPGFKKILKFHTEVYGGGGENYSSIMIRVKATVELEGDLTKVVTYMIKTFPQDGTGVSMVNMLGFFPKELEMYHKCIPEFEQLFSDVGKQVKFGPKSYTLKRNPGADYILLEDLSVLGFENVDRHEGLDKEHTESVLRLLAQFHAASVVKFATKTEDDPIFIMGNITESDRASFADMMEKMHDTFMECLLMTEFSAKYAEQLKQHHDGVIKNLIKLSTPDLNVLNHGDLWTNNIMFRHNDEGKVEQTIFVDFQISRLGSPAMDLYYFLLSSTNFYLKLSHFDVFIKYYHDHLVANLKQLNYTKDIPSLKHLHIDLLKYSHFAITTVTGVMAAALMDPTKDANFDNFWGKGDAGKKFKVQIKMSTPANGAIVTNGTNGTNGTVIPVQPESVPNVFDTVPKWVTQDIFESVLKNDIGDYVKIVSFIAAPALNPGENFLSVLLRVTIEVEVADGAIKTISYILKTNHSNSTMANFLDLLMLFPKEQIIYESIIPGFESLFKEAGKTIVFAPRSFKFAKIPPVDYILLEDVCRKSFRNANRLTGLDMVHMKHVLTKLAEFHAASACFHEHNGSYSDKFTNSIFNEKNREILGTLNKSDVFLSHLRKWKNCEQYADKLADIDTYLVDRIIQAAKFNASEFNVLNHGDLWSNNIMFQYDAFGKIKETYFIDFQIGKYGSPAYDLYYVILTSAQMDIKLSQFDYMVKFYHDKLIENLKLLQYHRPLPKLRNLHMALLKNGLSAYSVVSKILPVVMLDVKSFNSNDAVDDHAAMYKNLNYVRAMETIMPWLDNRGLLDFN